MPRRWFHLVAAALALAGCGAEGPLFDGRIEGTVLVPQLPAMPMTDPAATAFAPLAKVVVEAFPRGLLGPPARPAQTDGRGRYQLANLAAGYTYELRFFHQDYLFARVRAPARSAPDLPAEVDPPAVGRSCKGLSVRPTTVSFEGEDLVLEATVTDATHGTAVRGLGGVAGAFSALVLLSKDDERGLLISSDLISVSEFAPPGYRLRIPKATRVLPLRGALRVVVEPPGLLIGGSAVVLFDRQPE